MHPELNLPWFLKKNGNTYTLDAGAFKQIFEESDEQVTQTIDRGFLLVDLQLQENKPEQKVEFLLPERILLNEPNPDTGLTHLEELIWLHEQSNLSKEQKKKIFELIKEFCPSIYNINQVNGGKTPLDGCRKDSPLYAVLKKWGGLHQAELDKRHQAFFEELRQLPNIGRLFVNTTGLFESIRTFETICTDPRFSTIHFSQTYDDSNPRMTAFHDLFFLTADKKHQKSVFYRNSTNSYGPLHEDFYLFKNGNFSKDQLLKNVKRQCEIEDHYFKILEILAKAELNHKKLGTEDAQSLLKLIEKIPNFPFSEFFNLLISSQLKSSDAFKDRYLEIMKQYTANKEKEVSGDPLRTSDVLSEKRARRIAKGQTDLTYVHLSSPKNEQPRFGKVNHFFEALHAMAPHLPTGKQIYGLVKTDGAHQFAIVIEIIEKDGEKMPAVLCVDSAYEVAKGNDTESYYQAICDLVGEENFFLFRGEKELAEDTESKDFFIQPQNSPTDCETFGLHFINKLSRSPSPQLFQKLYQSNPEKTTAQQPSDDRLPGQIDIRHLTTEAAAYIYAPAHSGQVAAKVLEKNDTIKNVEISKKSHLNFSQYQDKIRQQGFFKKSATTSPTMNAIIALKKEAHQYRLKMREQQAHEDTASPEAVLQQLQMEAPGYQKGKSVTPRPRPKKPAVQHQPTTNPAVTAIQTPKASTVVQSQPSTATSTDPTHPKTDHASKETIDDLITLIDQERRRNPTIANVLSKIGLKLRQEKSELTQKFIQFLRDKEKTGVTKEDLSIYLERFSVAQKSLEWSRLKKGTPSADDLMKDLIQSTAGDEKTLLSKYQHDKKKLRDLRSQHGFRKEEKRHQKVQKVLKK